MVFSDALAAGTPVIATPVGDLPELIENHPVGVVADSASVAGIAAAIREAVRGTPRAHREALAGLALEFDPARAAAAVLDALAAP